MYERYREYIHVDEDFIPVFDEGWDKKYPARWKSFYPHECFLDILESVVDTLEGTRNEDRKSLWISGAYGTGKTFASFVIQHLLEDPIEDVENYFTTHKLKQSLMNRLIGLRNRGKILVARRSTSSGITNDYLLFNDLQNSIVESFKRNNLQYFGSKSLYREVMERLDHPNSPFDFRKIFHLEKNKFFPEYNSPEAVIQDLKKKRPEDNRGLLSKIIQLLLEQKQNIAVDVRNVRAWIADVIQGNNVHALLFIWDEFSDYFRQNKALTGLQEIVQVSSETPFYLFLITHKDYEQFLNDEHDRKRVMDRFKTHYIYMTEPTALRLMANVIRVKPQRKSEWQIILEKLWNTIKEKIRELFEVLDDSSMTVSLECFKGLLPIHPYSALLLSILSRFLSSNQRTMFQFLSGERNSRCNFRWFIENCGASTDTGEFLTCDVLWDYFFVRGNAEIPNNVRWMVNCFENVQNKFDESSEEMKVLKAVFLLSAAREIFAEQGTSYSRRTLSALITPTLSNLSLAFVGTDLEDNLRIILDKLEEKGVLWSRKEPENEVRYLLQEEITDLNRYQEILEQVKAEKTFGKILKDEGVKEWLLDQLSPKYLKERFQPFRCASSENWIGVLNATSPGHIPCVIVFTLQEEGKELNEEIENHLDEVSFECVVVNASSLPFGRVSLEEYWAREADVRYFKRLGRRDDDVKAYEEQRKNIITEWLERLQKVRFSVYYRVESSKGKNQAFVTRSISSEGLTGLSKVLEDIDKTIFCYGLEVIAEHESLFKQKQFGKEVVKMGSGASKISSRYRYLDSLRSQLEAAGILEDERYWEEEKHYDKTEIRAVVEMKKKVEEVIAKCFKDKGSVAIRDVYDVLQKRPFGLLNWVGTHFLLGFLLREYCRSQRYYRYDNRSTVFLNDDTLADMIFATLRGNDRQNEQAVIVKMTKKQELFCECARKIFSFIINEQRGRSIKGIQNAIREYLGQVKLPLWSAQFADIPSADSELSSCVCEIIKLFCDFVTCHYDVDNEEESDLNSGQEVKIAENIAERIEKSRLLGLFCSWDVDGVVNQLHQRFQVDSLRKGFENYLREEWSGLVDLARKLNFDCATLLRVIKERVSADASWLWNKEYFEKEMDEIQEDLKCLHCLQQFFHRKVSEEDTVETYLRKAFLPAKISHSYIQKELSDSQAQILEKVVDVCKNSSFEAEAKKDLYDAFSKHGEIIARFLTQEGFIQVIRNHSEEILTLSSNSLTEREICELYQEFPEEQFLCSKEEFIKNVREAWEEYQKTSKLNMLREAWRRCSGTSSPREWSKKYKIPIFWVLGEEALVRDICEVLEGERELKAHELEKACDFLENNEKVRYLRDLNKCNELFVYRLFPERKQILSFLGDIENLKTYLIRKIQKEPYEWYYHAQTLQEEAQEYWSELYRKYYQSKAIRKVQGMGESEAKQWLEKSLSADPWLGIALLAEK